MGKNFTYMKAGKRTLYDWMLKRTSIKKLTISRKIFAGRCWTWTELHLTSFRTDSTEQQLNWQLRIWLQMLSVFFWPYLQKWPCRGFELEFEGILSKKLWEISWDFRYEAELCRQSSNRQFIIWKSGFLLNFHSSFPHVGPMKFYKNIFTKM